MKTIWYLNHYAPSSNSPRKGRAFYLMKAIMEEGFKVAVIGASTHHLLSTEVLQNERFRFKDVDGVLFGWARTPAYIGNGLMRVLNMFTYAFQLIFLSRCLPTSHKQPDVIVASSVHLFHYPVALWLSWRFNAKIIFEVRDLWPLTLSELLSMPKWHPFYLINKGIESLAYRTADCTVSLMSNAFLHMKLHGLKEGRFFYIPNGIVFSKNDEAIPVCEHREQLESIRESYDFIIMYAGAHGIPNALNQLIVAAEILQKKHQSVAIVLVGDGGEKKLLQKKVKTLKLENLFFFNSVIPSQVQSVLGYADACFIGWQNKQIYKFGISANKLFEYMKAAKPIIQCIDSPDNPVSLSGCGVDVPPEKPALLADAIVSLSEKSKKRLVKMGLNGFEYAQKKHNYQFLAKQFIEACDV